MRVWTMEWGEEEEKGESALGAVATRLWRRGGRLPGGSGHRRGHPLVHLVQPFRFLERLNLVTWLNS